ncbi:hypothetical protein D3C80_1948150 [compost metagenome]
MAVISVSAAGQGGRAIAHGLKAGTVLGEPLAVGIEGQLEHLVDPDRELRIEFVVHPLALTAVEQQTTGTQLGQVAGYFRLAVVERAHQLANAELALSGDE